jgi:hypothetical protein
MSSSDVSAVTNHFVTPNEGFSTTLGTTTLSGATTVPLASTSGLTNATIFVGIIEPGGTKEQTFTGTVDTGGSQITGVKWTRGTNVDHSAGVTIVDYVTGTGPKMATKGLLVEHTQDGTHGNVTTDSITNTGAFTSTGAHTISGSWDGWVGANESWAYASASTITVPTDATTKYNYGDYVRITQSATVKYFVVTGVTATVLTVSGIYGAVVTNVAISANAYSKARNPQGVAGMLPLNPYKFHAYMTAAWSLAAGGVPTKIPFDTELYDTGSNFDAATNHRFVAPVAGFYWFSACWVVSVDAGNFIQAYLTKNGSTVLPGFEVVTGNSTFNEGASVSGILQLAASDYVEVYGAQGGTQHAGTGSTGSAQSTYFQGFLVSAA